MLLVDFYKGAPDLVRFQEPWSQEHSYLDKLKVRRDSDQPSEASGVMGRGTCGFGSARGVWPGGCLGTGLGRVASSVGTKAAVMWVLVGNKALPGCRGGSWNVSPRMEGVWAGWGGGRCGVSAGP